MDLCGASPEGEAALDEGLEEAVASALLDPQERLDTVLALIRMDEPLTPYVARLQEEGVPGATLASIAGFYACVEEGERTLKEALALKAA